MEFSSEVFFLDFISTILGCQMVWSRRNIKAFALRLFYLIPRCLALHRAQYTKLIPPDSLYSSIQDAGPRSSMNVCQYNCGKQNKMKNRWTSANSVLNLIGSSG